MAAEQTLAGVGPLDDFETKLIRVKAASLVRSGVVPRSDIEDVRQDLTMALLVAHGKVDVDPERRHGFSYTVVENSMMRLARDRLCSKRDPDRKCSIESFLFPSGVLNDSLEEITEPSLEPVVDLRLDVKELLSTLPNDLQGLAELLKTQSMAEVARQLCVPRSTLYQSVHSLRARFRRAGLEKYLPKSADTSDTVGVVPR